ncbi:MAG: hypothetical protein WCI17_04515 [bacterium]
MVSGIHLRLLQLGRAARNARVARAALRWLAQMLVIGLGCFWLDNLLRLPPAARWLLLVAGVAWPAWRFWREGLRREVWQVRPERTARELEARCGIGDNVLINACQFEAAPVRGMAAAFMRRTVEAGVARARALAPAALTEPRRLWRLAGAAAACGLIWAIYMLVFPRHAGNAWQRFSRPLSDIPPVGAYDVRLTPCGRVIVEEGEPLVFQATVLGASNRFVRLTSPPVLRLSRRREGGDAREVPLIPTLDGGWRVTLENVQEPFTARVLADDSWSPAATVEVRRRPRLTDSLFHLSPPAYTGLKAEDRPGPPAALTVPEGSRVEARISMDHEIAAVAWQTGTNRVPFAGRRKSWQVSAIVLEPGEYRIVAAQDGAEQEIARGVLQVQPDRPPEVTLVADDRNRLVWPGEALDLPVLAEDDYGVRDMRVTARHASRENAAQTVLGSWACQGPPGRRKVQEHLAFTVDPKIFEGGESYTLEAQARDFSPAGNTGRSAPLVLRVRRPQDATSIDPAEQRLLQALQQAIDAQRRSLGLTCNLQLHLDEALQAGHLDRHRATIGDAQGSARTFGREAQRGLTEAKSDAAARLGTLVEKEMGWVLEDVARLNGKESPALTRRAKAIAERQTYILTELLSLFGRVAAAARVQADKGKDGAVAPPPPSATEEMRELRDLLKDFAKAEKRILEQSKALLEKKPEDLTDEEKEILGQLAREEQRWADLLKEKLNDMAKTPLQDFADGSIAAQFNEVWQDISKAASELYAKKLDLAVPQEQSGLENAKELVQNLEKWLSDMPDNKKWSMEEPPTMPDAPLAELPKELEDIVGDLLDKEEALTEEVEDVTSSWIDSIDKGAGWDAADGPISSMSAKGVTGNMLPNQMEVGGRSGEGRSGRSAGQMVQSTAEGKDGRQTPSRVTPTPFESGSVDDKSRQDPGGATGGGKLSGFAGKGLRGPAPPPRLDQMQRLAGKQAEIRQGAEKLSLGLRSQGLPSGDLEEAALRMREVEALAGAGRGGEIRRAFTEAVGNMREARDALREDAVVRQERGGLSRKEADALWTGLQDDIPAGYEDLVSAYYRRLSEGAAAVEKK